MTGAARIRVLLCDDHAMVRGGYRALLAQQADMEVVGEAGEGAEAARLAASLQPDVVVMDLVMEGLGGLEAIGRIRQRCASTRVLVCSMHTHPAHVRQACAAGALGYLGKGNPPDDLLRAVRDTHAGRRFLGADVAQALAWERLGGELGPLDTLTPREFEVLRMLVDGRDIATIATTLCISQKTAMNLHYIVKRKLGVRSDIELVRLALRLKLVDLLADPATPEPAASRA